MVNPTDPRQADALVQQRALRLRDNLVAFLSGRSASGESRSWYDDLALACQWHMWISRPVNWATTR